MKKSSPVISVVIAAHNEEAFLSKCFGSLAEQDFPFPYEVIVVNNASFDRTAHVARTFGVKVVSEPRLGLARACRTGFAAASAPIIARTDADTIVPKHWLSTIYTYFAEHPEVVGISGPTFPLETSWWENFIYYPSNVAWMLLEKLMGNGFFFANMAVRKEAYRACGGFDPSLKFGEDAYMGKQLSRVGKVAIVLSLYIFVSTRRIKAMGIVNFFAKYILANYFLTWVLKRSPIAADPIRIAPAFTSAPKRPYVYLCTLPATLVLFTGSMGFLQTTRGEAIAREVIADTKGVVSKQQVYLRRGATFIQNVKQNGLRYYQHWNRKESSYDTHELPTNHQG